MEKSSQIAWKIVPLRHFCPLKVVPLIEVLLKKYDTRSYIQDHRVQSTSMPTPTLFTYNSVNQQLSVQLHISAAERQL
jgi:hypothetical protein